MSHRTVFLGTNIKERKKGHQAYKTNPAATTKGSLSAVGRPLANPGKWSYGSFLCYSNFRSATAGFGGGALACSTILSFLWP